MSSKLAAELMNAPQETILIRCWSLIFKAYSRADHRAFHNFPPGMLRNSGMLSILP